MTNGLNTGYLIASQWPQDQSPTPGAVRLDGYYVDKKTALLAMEGKKNGGAIRATLYKATWIAEA